jgi:uncharacterized membrane protein YccC
MLLGYAVRMPPPPSAITQKRIAPSLVAPDLARLPITRNLRALSLAEGARAGLAVAVMVAASQYLALPALREAALGALLTCLCDPEGPIRRRVPVLLGFTLLGTAVTGSLGLLRGLGPVVALPTGVLALFLASFGRIYGQAPQQLGALLSTVIILSLDRPLPLGEAAELSAAFALGAAWATVLTLAIWRLYPFQSARRAVAEAYHMLAALAADLRKLLYDPATDDVAWEAHARAHRRSVRDSIEVARVIVIDTLRSRGANSPRAMQSLIRLEAADQIFGALIALSDLLEHAGPEERRLTNRVLRRVRPLLIVLTRVTRADMPGHHPRIRRAIDAMDAEVAQMPAGNPLRAAADVIVERLRIAYTLSVPANLVPGVDAQGRRLPLRQRLVQPLRANLTWRSPALRHALRSAVVAAPALGFTMVWFTPYDHWLTITIVATMQPFFALTYARALERVAGTALGGFVAAAVGLICTTPMAVAGAMFPLAVVAMAVRAVNFGLFMVALTPLVVLLVESGTPQTSEWRIAVARAGFTVIGGLVAVAAAFTLWPSRGPRQLPGLLKDAIAAHARYADAELGYLLNEIQAPAVEAARRNAGLTSNSLEASVSSALYGPGSAGMRDRLEATLVIDAALRRCAGRLLAMQLDPVLRTTLPPAALRVWRDWVSGSLQLLASGQAALPPRPETTTVDALNRLARQVELMAGAIRRVSGPRSA